LYLAYAEKGDGTITFGTVLTKNLCYIVSIFVTMLCHETFN
jgi:hypothetical protein